jgi:putative hydrolase of the HAD superfamily
MIKALLFDFGDTIFVPDWKSLNDSMLEETGISVILSPIIKDIYSKKVVIGKLSMKDIFKKIIDNSNLSVDVDFVVGRYYQNYMKYSILDKKMIDLIKKLKNKMKIYGLTNTNEIHSQANKDRKLFSYFDNVFLSHKIGMKKPDKKLYNYVLRKINLSPQEVLFIDDKIENIESAREMNIHAIKYENYEKLLVEIKKLDLL